MKNLVTNVLTFIGVIAIIVTVRGAQPVENFIDSLHANTSYSGSTAEDYAQDMREIQEEVKDLARDYFLKHVKPNVSSACWNRLKCTDSEIEFFGHALAKVEMLDLEPTEDWYAYYNHEHRTIVFEYPPTYAEGVDLTDPEVVAAMDSEVDVMIEAACGFYDMQLGMGYKYLFYFVDQYGGDYGRVLSQEDCS
jgi:hypothetical protein